MTFLRTMKGKNDDIGLNSVMVLSFLLHALVLSIVFLSPSWPTPKWTFGPVYTGNLVKLPPNLVRVKKASLSSGGIARIESRDRSVAIKKRVSRALTTPIKRLKTHKKVLTGDVDRAIENIKKRSLYSQEDITRQQSSPGSAEMTMKMKVYYSIVWSKIKAQWALPEGILPKDNFVAVIGVKVLRNGTVADLDFEKKSGNTYFDESAMKAIKKASPLPALPDWIKGSNIELGIRFHSSELK